MFPSFSFTNRKCSTNGILRLTLYALANIIEPRKMAQMTTQPERQREREDDISGKPGVHLSYSHLVYIYITITRIYHIHNIHVYIY